jgi:hypothetical protein
MCFLQRCCLSNLSAMCLLVCGLGLCCLAPISIIFQLYRDGQFFWRVKPEKTINFYMKCNTLCSDSSIIYRPIKTKWYQYNKPLTKSDDKRKKLIKGNRCLIRLFPLWFLLKSPDITYYISCRTVDLPSGGAWNITAMKIPASIA